MKKAVILTICGLFILFVGCGKSTYTESVSQSTSNVVSQVIQTALPAGDIHLQDNKQNAEIDDEVLIDRLDKVSDESISYVYNQSHDNITIGDKYEGDFTGAGKQELMVIFKLLGMPHAGGLDCSVAAVYDRQTLKIITQKTFPADECKFTTWKDDKGREYLVFSGTTTYQGHSAYTFQVLKPRAVWEQVLPQDNSMYTNQDMKFEFMPGGIVRVYKPVYKTDGSGDDPVLKKKYYLKWNPSTLKLEKYIPDNWLGEDGESCFDADSISPNGRYALVSHEWGFDEGSYVILYDIKDNKYISKYDMLAQEFGFNWSRDNSKVCVTRLARIWVELSFIDIRANKVEDFMSAFDMMKKFQEQGAKFKYKLNENRPDPVFTFLEWSPDSKKILAFYQWYDTDYKAQTGSFVYNVIDHSVSRLKQNTPVEADHYMTGKPKGFKW